MRYIRSDQHSLRETHLFHGFDWKCKSIQGSPEYEHANCILKSLTWLNFKHDWTQTLPAPAVTCHRAPPTRQQAWPSWHGSSHEINDNRTRFAYAIYQGTRNTVWNDVTVKCGCERNFTSSTAVVRSCLTLCNAPLRGHAKEPSNNTANEHDRTYETRSNHHWCWTTKLNIQCNPQSTHSSKQTYVEQLPRPSTNCLTNAFTSAILRTSCSSLAAITKKSSLLLASIQNHLYCWCCKGTCDTVVGINCWIQSTRMYKVPIHIPHKALLRQTSSNQ